MTESVPPIEPPPIGPPPLPSIMPPVAPVFVTPPPVLVSPRRRLARPRISLVGLALFFSTCIAAIVLLGEGVQIGTHGLILTMILAFVPVPLYLSLVLWLDRMEKEPAHLLVLAVVYGATYAICLGGSINDAVQKSFGEKAATVISAPISEELFKGSFILGLFLFKRDEFDGIVDGVVYAAMVGLGFAAIENIEYYGRAIHDAATGLHHGDPNFSAQVIAQGRVIIAGTFLMRGVFSPFVHPLFTSMTGIGFGIASETRSAAARWLCPLAGYLLAVILHATWNGSQMIGGPLFFAAIYFVIFVPTFIGMIVLMRHSMKKELGIVRDELLCDVNSGYLSRAEYEALCSGQGRKAELRMARAQGGSKLARLHRALQQAATELAFHRFRVARGISAPDWEVDANYFRTLNDLQTRIRHFRGGSS